METTYHEQQNISGNHRDTTDAGQTEKILRTIADATTALIAYIDLDQRYLFVNTAYARWRGRSPEEFIGRTVSDITGEGAYEQIRPHLEESTSGHVVTFEITIPFGEGGTRCLAVSCVPDITEQGRINGVVITINDITEQKEVEADLRRKEQELRDFIENSAVGLHWVGPDGKILWANRAELDLLGYSEAEYVGRYISEFHADQSVIEDILGRLSARETLHDYEARLKASDGSVKHVLISSNVMWDDEGRFVHTRCFTRDVTERKQVEEALRESEERHRAILEQVSEAIFLIDPHTKRFVVTNPAFCKLVGYSADELVDMAIYDVLPYERERIDRAVLRALNEGDYRVSDRLYKRKDGSLVNVEVGITPVVYAGKLVLCEIVRDVTERKRAEEERNQLLLSEQAARTEAEEALRVRDELLAVVSHDLKNPLAAIRGNAQLLRQRIGQSGIEDSAKLATLLTRIDTAQAKMNILINELMDFGRLQAGLPLTLQRRPTDLVALVRQVAAEQQETTQRHKIEVEANAQSITGKWDAERLERAITNIISNAIKYSPEGGDINVLVAVGTAPNSEHNGEGRSNGWASVVVKDNGLGIDPEDLPHIFEWFRRASSVSGRISGAGIGLASSLHAVRQHGGTIDVESEPGAGSTFTIGLPLDM